MGQNDDMTIRAPDPGDSDRSNKEPSQEPASSGFQEAPKYETPPVYSQPPAQPPRPPETPSYSQVVEPPRPPETPSYGQVVEPPRPPETPSYGQVVEPPAKKSNKTLWIILIVVVLLICCCCIVAIVWGGKLMTEFNIDNFEDLMDEFSQLIKIVPAYI